MKIAILGARGGWHEARLVEALEARGIAPTVVPITRLIGEIGGTVALADQGVVLDECDAVVVRAIPGGSLEQIIFRVDALHRLTRLGIPVINGPRCIERSVDKYHTSCLLEEAGLPTPRTIACERFEDAMAALETLGGDVVLKPLFGAEGRGMARVSDPDIAYRTFRALELTRREVTRVLVDLGRDDARWAYRAIRLARPGGLGKSGSADVRSTPSIGLREAMALAADRDSIAAEYAGDFRVTFTVALPALRRAMRRGLGLLDAIAHAHLEVIAAVPDTLVARKCGRAVARGRLGSRRARPPERRLTHARRPRRGRALRPLAAPRRESAQPRDIGRPDRRVAVRLAADRGARAGRPMSEFRVRVEKDYTVFAAGHFITYEGHLCEALHGHNYRVAAAFEGPLDENFYVLDFTRIKRLLRTVVDRLDHRMLLPTRSERVRVQQSGNEIVATYQDRRYVFPAGDVVLLPIPNTTAEMLAQWIGGEIEAMLSPAELAQTTVMEVEVEESFGQSAVYRRER